MKILALDLSLTRTGYAVGPGPHGLSIPPRGQDRGPARLAFYRTAVTELLSIYAADVVVLEGYSFGQARGSSHSHALGELGGVVRLLLFERAVPFVEVAPASLKKYATGKGNAPKAAVLAEAIRRLGYGGNDDNEADALWLRAMALDYYQLETPTMPQSHRAALEKIEWPEITPLATAAAA